MAGLTLPPAQWRNREGLDGLVRAIGAAEGNARFVGGAVRDTLLGLPVADIDVATRHAPETVMALLEAAGIKAVPTGIAHGTVTAVLAGGPVEITTLRRDVSTDGRHATVAFTDDWREDAARRDFTINALYSDPISGQVFDYFGGLEDLEARRIRFIGDPFQRIAEDHLRILRFFRFLARFGDEPDAEGLAACTARANDLMALSRERIADELLKLLVAKDAVRVVALMIEHRILAPVLPEIASADALRRLATREAEAGVAPDAIRRLAALISAQPGSAGAVGARLKLSNAHRKRLVMATEPANGNARELAYRIGIESALDRLLLDERPIADALDIRDWKPPKLPMLGGALVARGVRAGPEISRLLRTLEDRWIAEGFPDAARTASIADEIVADAAKPD